ncbi:hypothetical protein [Legionella sp. km772]|uniref:hypothetical protein n=1 Tax=Legionella sp. km772 TaxID=2498111 RepID=UPI000F8C6530|nr:hypothetical protein [Legionella sp. km772]RUR12961.1 hypothetical protein ELY15_03790 [Legionella sp. km772]
MKKKLSIKKEVQKIQNSNQDIEVLILKLERLLQQCPTGESSDKDTVRKVLLARSGDLEQNSGKIRAIPGLLVHSPYSQNGLSTSP